MVRCSHYPQSPAFLDACDELGLLAWGVDASHPLLGQAEVQVWSVAVTNTSELG